MQPIASYLACTHPAPYSLVFELNFHDYFPFDILRQVEGLEVHLFSNRLWCPLCFSTRPPPAGSRRISGRRDLQQFVIICLLYGGDIRFCVPESPASMSTLGFFPDRACSIFLVAFSMSLIYYTDFAAFIPCIFLIPSSPRFKNSLGGRPQLILMEANS